MRLLPKSLFLSSALLGIALAGCPSDNSLPPQCQPQVKRCNSNIIEVCSADGLYWQTFQTCSAGQYCNNGACAQSPPSCGNSVCDTTETCQSCPGDCGNCCGNGICDSIYGESAATCAADCGSTNTDGGVKNDANTGPKRIFVTKESYNGDFANQVSGATGLQAGDQLCTQAAQAASLGGIWKAWLSDSLTHALNRINDVGPWSRVKGATVFQNKAALTTQALAPILVDQFGGPIKTQEFAWTGTLRTGLASDKHCRGWTSVQQADEGMIGSPEESNHLWTEVTGSFCNYPHHLICIEQ